jgi:hypothetical protein
MKILDASEPEFGGPMTEDEVRHFLVNSKKNVHISTLLCMNCKGFLSNLFNPMSQKCLGLIEEFVIIVVRKAKIKVISFDWTEEKEIAEDYL